MLTRARRRCAFCFGLNRDADLKHGQIAHIDHDAANDSLENLVFLCFEHHDQYETKTSQSKNFTPAELRNFRHELDTTIRAILSAPVTFGSAQVTMADPVAGTYVRTSDSEQSAEILVERLDSNRIRVTGLALFGLQREYGPNIGELDCEIELQDYTAFYSFDNGQSRYWAEFHFTGSGAVIHERQSTGMFGMGASFDGVYRRVA